MTTSLTSVSDKASMRHQEPLTTQTIILKKSLLFNEGPCPFIGKCPLYKTLNRIIEKKSSKASVKLALMTLQERCEGECGGCLRYRQFKNGDNL